MVVVRSDLSALCLRYHQILEEEEEEDEETEFQPDLTSEYRNCFDHDFAARYQPNVSERPLLVENAYGSPASLVAGHKPVWASEAVYPYSGSAVYELSRGRRVGEVVAQAGLAGRMGTVLADLEKVDLFDTDSNNFEPLDEG
jgi:hypothetical protein